MKSKCQGATILEAALSMPLFILFVLFILDIGRFFFVYIFLNFAAHNAVNLAAGLPIDARLTVNANSNSCGESYSRYVRLIEEAAMENALRVAAPSGSGAWVELVPFEHYYESPQNCSLDNGNVIDVAFLRPGEKVRGYPGQSNEFEYFHPTRPFGLELWQGWPGSNENWSGVLRAHPIEVRLQASFRAITPLVPELRIVASQAAFGSSDSFDQGGPGNIVPPTPTPTPVCDLCPDAGCEYCSANECGCDPACAETCMGLPVEECNDCFDRYASQCENTCPGCEQLCDGDQGVTNCEYCMGSCDGCYLTSCQEEYDALYDDCVDPDQPGLTCGACWADVAPNCPVPECPCPVECDNPADLGLCLACLDAGCTCGDLCQDIFNQYCSNQAPLQCHDCVAELDIPAGLGCEPPQCGDVCDYYCEPGPETTTQDCTICLQEECSLQCDHECIQAKLADFELCKAVNPGPEACEKECIADIPVECLGDNACPSCSDANHCNAPSGPPGSLVPGPDRCQGCVSYGCGCITSCFNDCIDSLTDADAGPYERHLACVACNEQIAPCNELCPPYDPCSDNPLCTDLAQVGHFCVAGGGPSSRFCQECGDCCDGPCGGGDGGM